MESNLVPMQWFTSLQFSLLQDVIQSSPIFYGSLRFRVRSRNVLNVDFILSSYCIVTVIVILGFLSLWHMSVVFLILSLFQALSSLQFLSLLIPLVIVNSLSVTIYCCHHMGNSLTLVQLLGGPYNLDKLKPCQRTSVQILGPIGKIRVLKISRMHKVRQ